MAESANRQSSPPRLSRSLWRALLVTAAWAGCVVALRAGWAWEGNRRLERAVAEVQARGEPIRVEDYPAPGPVAGPLNAATDLNAAARSVSLTRDAYFDDDLFPFNDDTRGKVARHLEANAAPIARAELALDKPDAAWGLALKRPVIAMLLPGLNEQRQLADVIRLAALAAVDKGDVPRAIRLVRVGLRQADALESHVPFSVVHLAAAGLGTGATDTLRVIIHTARRQGDPGPDARREMAMLIAALLDERATDAGRVMSAYGQRTMILDAYESQVRGSPASNQVGRKFLIQPAFTFDEARAVRLSAVGVDSARAMDYPGAMATFPPDRLGEFPDRPMFGKVTHLLSDAVLRVGFMSKSSVQAHFRWILDRRAGATRLAAWLYSIDHGGKAPPDLAALVPAYLPAVPRDPYDAARSLSYRSDGPQPCVYSVSMNGVDNGGTSRSTKGPGNINAWPDMVYDLDPMLPVDERAAMRTRQPSR